MFCLQISVASVGRARGSWTSTSTASETTVGIVEEKRKKKRAQRRGAALRRTEDLQSRTQKQKFRDLWPTLARRGEWPARCSPLWRESAQPVTLSPSSFNNRKACFYTARGWCDAGAARTSRSARSATPAVQRSPARGHQGQSQILSSRSRAPLWFSRKKTYTRFGTNKSSTGPRHRVLQLEIDPVFNTIAL